MFSRSSRGRPENVLGTSWINLPRTFLGSQIRTSTGCHFETPPGCQIVMFLGRQFVTSLGWSRRIFRRCPGDVGGGPPQDALGNNIYRLGQSHLDRQTTNISALSSGNVNKYEFLTGKDKKYQKNTYYKKLLQWKDLNILC